MDILAEPKQPFSLRTFFTETVVDWFSRAKRFLEEKGVLYFFLSPFMQKSRLILELFLILLAILAGVIPRSMHLIHEIKERNAASEMATVIDSPFTFGSLTVTPAASSQYDRQHVLAFWLNGKGTLPSNPEAYRVTLGVMNGVSYPDDISYSWKVIPVGESERLLLIYTDHRNQDDAVGNFNLTVYLEGEGPETINVSMIPVVLGDGQETGPLFTEQGIDLSMLADHLVGEQTSIADARESLAEAVDAYRLDLERIQALPVSMNVSLTVDQVQAYVDANQVYQNLTDESTTREIPAEESLPEDLYLPISVTMNETTYTTEGFSELDRALTDEEAMVKKELESLEQTVSKILKELENTNRETSMRYDKLVSCRLLLNQTINLSDFYGAQSIHPTGLPEEVAAE